MGSTQVTLVANTATAVNIPAPTGRVTATLVSSAAEVSITADGTAPVVPTNNTILSGTQATLPGVVGAQTVVQPPNLPGSVLTGPGTAGPAGAGLPQIQLISSGTPVVQLEW